MLGDIGLHGLIRRGLYQIELGIAGHFVFRCILLKPMRLANCRLWHNPQTMWDVAAQFFAKIATVVWFIGAILMIITIPACALKIFSALWESDDPEETQAVIEKRSSR